MKSTLFTLRKLNNTVINEKCNHPMVKYCQVFKTNLLICNVFRNTMNEVSFLHYEDEIFVFLLIELLSSCKSKLVS